MAEPDAPVPPGPDDVVTVTVGGKSDKPMPPPVIEYGAGKGKHPDSKVKPPMTAA